LKQAKPPGGGFARFDFRKSRSTLLPCSLLLLPVLVLARNTNPIFSSLGYLDPWVYYGFFRNFLLFQRDLFPGTYYGSRLSWIVPGYLINRIFPPLAANYVLHLAVFYVALFSLYFILAKTLDRATALLTAIVFGLNPYLWVAVGGDYPDGASIAFCLLTLALLTHAAYKPSAVIAIALAGISSAALVYCNITWTVLLPAFAVYYLVLARAQPGSSQMSNLGRLCLWGVLGAVALTVVLGAVNYELDGPFWFYEPSVQFVMKGASLVAEYKSPDLQWIWHAKWLLFPAVLLLSSLLSIPHFIRDAANERRTAFLMTGMLVFTAAFFVTAELTGRALIEVHYYASMLLPFAFLAGGANLLRLPEEWSVSRKSLFCASTCVVFPVVFWDPAGRVWSVEKKLGLPLVLALTVIAILWRTWQPRAASALAFLLLTFGALAIASFMWLQQWPTGTELRDGFLRINQSLSYIRAAAPGGVRFWFDGKETNHLEFRSLASVYLYQYSIINFNFPELPSDIQVPVNTTIVVPSTREDVPQLAANVLNGHDLKVQTISANAIARGSVHYFLYILRLVRPPESELPLLLGPDGLLSETNQEIALPMENWQRSEGEFNRDGNVLRIATANKRYSYAAYYNKPFIANHDGSYLFVLHCRKIEGRFTFGALKDDKSVWVAQAPEPIIQNGVLSAEFVVKLKAGQRVWLQTANNHPRGDHSSRFTIEGLNVYRLR